MSSHRLSEQNAEQSLPRKPSLHEFITGRTVYTMLQGLISWQGKKMMLPARSPGAKGLLGI
jgi:hypothetical protein